MTEVHLCSEPDCAVRVGRGQARCNYCQGKVMGQRLTLVLLGLFVAGLTLLLLQF